MRRVELAALLLAASAVFSLEALAQSSKAPAAPPSGAAAPQGQGQPSASSMGRCTNPRLDPDQRIAACTLMIEKGRLAEGEAAVAYNNRAIATHFKGQYDRAILDHDEAIRLRPDYAEAYSDRGNARLAKGLYAMAVKDYTDAIKIQPGAPSYYNNRCFAYAVLGQTDEALADCDLAIKLAPKRTATLFDSRGYAQLRAKRYEAAIRDYNTALGMDPKYATSLWGRGYAYLRMGEKAKAEQDFHTAKVIDAAIDYKMVELGLTR